MATDQPVSVAYCRAIKNRAPNEMNKKNNASIKKLDTILDFKYSGWWLVKTPTKNNTNPTTPTVIIDLFAFAEI
jgi:hypothetical protein